MSRATGTVPERVQSRVHTTEPTGPVPEPFHCDHIARWSARSGTTGRSGTGVNTGARLQTWGESTFNDSESDSGRLFDSESESSQFGYDSESDSDSSNISISDSDSESDSDSNFQLLI